MMQPSILKSHKRSKMNVAHFYRLYSINHCWLSLKCIATNFVVVVSVLQPICCHIGSGMPYLCIFVEEVVPFSGAITDKWVLTLVCGRN